MPLFHGYAVVHRNSFFEVHYQNKQKSTNRFGGTLKKKEALCAVNIKLIRVVFALILDKKVFAGETNHCAQAGVKKRIDKRCGGRRIVSPRGHERPCEKA